MTRSLRSPSQGLLLTTGVILAGPNADQSRHHDREVKLPGDRLEHSQHSASPPPPLAQQQTSPMLLLLS